MSALEIQTFVGPGVVGRANPAEGSGILVYYENNWGSPKKKYVFRFQTPPWHHSGGAPFVWDYVEPVGEREYAIIRIVATRAVSIEIPRALSRPAVLGPNRPRLQIYRVQHDGALPEFGDTISIENVVNLPSFWRWGAPQGLYEDVAPPRPDQQVAVIRTFENGVEIRDVTGKFQVTVRAPLEDPAAFAYELLPDGLGRDGLVMRIVSTHNISPSLSSSKGIYVQKLLGLRNPSERVFVFYAEASSVQIPPQGTSLEGRFNWRPFPSNKIVKRQSRYLRIATLVFEFTIGLIPYVGAAYGAAEFLAALSDRRSFWGEPLDQDSLVFMGIGLAFSTALGAREMLRVASTNVKAKAFTELLDEVSSAAFARRYMDPYFLESLSGLSGGDVKKTAAALRDYFNGRRSASEVLRLLPPAIGDALLRVRAQPHLVDQASHNVLMDINEAMREFSISEKQQFLADLFGSPLSSSERIYDRLLAKDPTIAEEFRWISLRRRLTNQVFEPNFTGFRAEPLRILFAKYVSGKHARSQPSLSALKWALRMTTRSAAHRILERTLGAGYKTLLREVLRGARVPLELTPAARVHWASLRNPYGPYVDLVESNKGFGHFFQADHLLEQRFAVVTGGEGVGVDEWTALLVPRSSHIRGQLTGYDGYDHETKTAQLNELIRHGAEEMYSIQELWDAHVWTYKSLAPRIWETIVDELQEAMEEIVKATGKEVDFGRNQTAEMFLPDRWKQLSVSWARTD